MNSSRPGRPATSIKPLDNRRTSLAASTRLPARSAELSQATQAERDHWTIGPRGISVHWPDIDEDIAIWEILGIAEDTYLRSLRETPVG